MSTFSPHWGEGGGVKRTYAGETSIVCVPRAGGSKSPIFCVRTKWTALGLRTRFLPSAKIPNGQDLDGSDRVQI